MMDALLASDGLTLPCKLIYGNTNTTQCPNCLVDSITGKSANTYNGTGPSPFIQGSICPMCAGQFFIPVEASDVIYMAVLWESQRSKFIKTGVPLKIEDAYVQTICGTMTNYPLLQKAREVIFDTTMEGYTHQRYQRHGDPTPIGLGDSRYIITFWRRAG